MKVRIDCDESYPVYSFKVAREVHRDDDPYVKKVDPRTVRRWQRIEKLYDQLQAELAEAYKR